jgi:DNA-binding MarR family transcriptional regulator
MVVCRGGQVETKKMQRRQLSKLDECRDCVCLALRTAARRITQGYDRALSGTGLRVTQFSLLVMIYHLGAPAMKILAAMLDSDPTTITRNVQGLVRRRLVALSPGRDLRERKVTLTSRGETVLLRALPNWQKAQAVVATSLNRSELASLRALLEQVGRRNGNVGRKRPRQAR